MFAARALNHLAQAALAGNEIAHAEDLAREALTAVAERGERQGIAEGLEALAAVAAACEDPQRAATLASAAAAIRETIASRAAAFDIAITGRFLDRIRASASEEQWRRAWDRGHQLGSAAAVAIALADQAPARPFQARAAWLTGQTAKCLVQRSARCGRGAARPAPSVASYQDAWALGGVVGHRRSTETSLEISLEESIWSSTRP